MGFAREVADRVVSKDHGEIVEDATSTDFFGSPRSERAQEFQSKPLTHREIARGHSVVFIHTGGLPAIFAYQADLLAGVTI